MPPVVLPNRQRRHPDLHVEQDVECDASHFDADGDRIAARAFQQDSDIGVAVEGMVGAGAAAVKPCAYHRVAVGNPFQKSPHRASVSLSTAMGVSFLRSNGQYSGYCPRFPCAAKRTASSAARNSARALLMHSACSAAGEESWTMPAPAWTCIFPSFTTEAR